MLDEPTNDLDIETLELLEERLLDYHGTILMVSHDRTFLDNVVTHVFVFEEQGQVNNYVGGYTYWQDNFAKQSIQKKTATKTSLSANDNKKQVVENASVPETSARKKRSYKVQRELDQLPEKIAQREAAIEAINQQIADPAFYDSDSEQVNHVLSDLAEQQAELDRLYARWEELES